MFKKIFFSAFFALISLSAFSAEKAAPSPKVKIDFQLNTKTSDKKNYLKLKTDSSTHSDFFDAVSGASKNHSTRESRNIFYENTGKQLLCPKGLRSLLLFASSSPEFLTKDSFLAENKNETITITFSHRGTDFKITSDKNGIISSPESFQLQKQQKEQNTAPQREETTFSKDLPEGSAKIYKGSLKASLSPSGILKISGTLVLTELPPQNEQTQETQEVIPSENTKKIDESQIDS